MRFVWQKHWRKVIAGLYLIVGISIPAFLLYGFAQRQACLQGTSSDLGVSDLKECRGNDAGWSDVTVVQLHIGYERVCTNDQLTFVRNLGGLKYVSQSSTYIRKSIVSTKKSRALRIDIVQHLLLAQGLPATRKMEKKRERCTCTAIVSHKLASV